MFGNSPYDIAPGSSGRFGGYASRAGSTDNAPYANVFADVSNLYLPKTVKSQFNWCEYFSVMDPLIHAAVSKISAYPITDLAFLSDNTWINKTYQYVFEEVFQIRAFLVEVLLDYHTYGNSFVYVHHPLRKMLECRECKELTPVESADYTWTAYQFMFTCPKCKNLGYARVKDQYIKSLKDLRLIRVNPNHMEIEHNPATGRTIYSYTIPATTANAITVGRKDTLRTIPQAYITAVASGKRLVFKAGTIFHLKRTSISRHDAGWGLPLITPVMKTAFFYRVLLKAQEAIALDHIVPMRIFFPQAADPKADPYTTYNLLDWQEHVKSEIATWRKDPNYMPVMPYPVGHQVVGGQGKMLLLHNEIKVLQEQILAGLGVPSEFVFGGMRWSGSSVSMRTMENTFLRMREDIQHLIKFIVRDISNAFGIPQCEIKQKPFRMADDLQKAAYDLQLVDRKFLSPETLMKSRDFDWDDEQAKIHDGLAQQRKVQEQLAMDGAEINGAAGVVSAKYQAEQQKTLQENMPPQPMQPGQPGMPPGQEGMPPGGPPGQEGLPPEAMDAMGVPPQDTAMPPAAPQQLPPVPPSGPGRQLLAEQAARSLFGLDTFERPKALVRLRNSMPGLYPDVLEELNRLQVDKFAAGPPEERKKR